MFHVIIPLEDIVEFNATFFEVLAGNWHFDTPEGPRDFQNIESIRIVPA